MSIGVGLLTLNVVLNVIGLGLLRSFGQHPTCLVLVGLFGAQAVERKLGYWGETILLLVLAYFWGLLLQRLGLTLF